MTDEQIAELIEIYRLVEKRTKCPDDLYIPDYGWVIRVGKVTEDGKKYFEDYQKKKTIK